MPDQKANQIHPSMPNQSMPNQSMTKNSLMCFPTKMFFSIFSCHRCMRKRKQRCRQFQSEREKPVRAKSSVEPLHPESKENARNPIKQVYKPFTNSHTILPLHINTMNGGQSVMRSISNEVIWQKIRWHVPYLNLIASKNLILNSGTIIKASPNKGGAIRVISTI